METKRAYAVPILLAVVVLVVVPLSVYVGSYFVRGVVWPDHRGKVRSYPTTLEARLFKPAAALESVITGSTVFALYYPSDARSPQPLDQH
jgi:hypothetical protein